MYPTRPATFTYHRPSSVDEAVSLLGALPDARPLAGGHSLLPAMKLRLEHARGARRHRAHSRARRDRAGRRRPSDRGARDARRRGRIREPSVSVCPVLGEAAALIGDRQVRNRGTIGGSLAHADPGADYPTVVTALGATITATGPNGSAGDPGGRVLHRDFHHRPRAGRAADVGLGAVTGTGQARRTSSTSTPPPGTR